jgi:hypothetical protein
MHRLYDDNECEPHRVVVGAMPRAISPCQLQGQCATMLWAIKPIRIEDRA